MRVGQADKQTNRQTDRHINTMTRTGLRAGPNEKKVPITQISPDIRGEPELFIF